MENPPTTPPLPAEYYRRHVTRVRRLASEATTHAVREHLLDVAAQYERLAERVDAAMLRAEPATFAAEAASGRRGQEG